MRRAGGIEHRDHRAGRPDGAQDDEMAAISIPQQDDRGPYKTAGASRGHCGSESTRATVRTLTVTTRAARVAM
jgi:hypothetical protein